MRFRELPSLVNSTYARRVVHPKWTQKFLSSDFALYSSQDCSSVSFLHCILYGKLVDVNKPSLSPLSHYSKS